MSRIRMVTRTLTITLANALVCNLETNTIETEVIRVNGYYATPDDKAFQKAIKACAPDKLIAKVTSLDYEETLYGMEESEFLKYAKVLPPRTKSDDNEEDVEE